MFEPITLNQAFQYARQVELALDSHAKKTSTVTRPYAYQPE